MANQRSNRLALSLSMLCHFRQNIGCAEDTSVRMAGTVFLRESTGFDDDRLVLALLLSMGKEFLLLRH